MRPQAQGSSFACVTLASGLCQERITCAVASSASASALSRNFEEIFSLSATCIRIRCHHRCVHCSHFLVSDGKPGEEGKPADKKAGPASDHMHPAFNYALLSEVEVRNHSPSRCSAVADPPLLIGRQCSRVSPFLAHASSALRRSARVLATPRLRALT
jgi:hypothetical protein